MIFTQYHYVIILFEIYCEHDIKVLYFLSKKLLWIVLRIIKVKLCVKHVLSITLLWATFFLNRCIITPDLLQNIQNATYNLFHIKLNIIFLMAAKNSLAIMIASNKCIVPVHGEDVGIASSWPINISSIDFSRHYGSKHCKNIQCRCFHNLIMSVWIIWNKNS